MVGITEEELITDIVDQWFATIVDRWRPLRGAIDQVVLSGTKEEASNVPPTTLLWSKMPPDPYTYGRVAICPECDQNTIIAPAPGDYVCPCGHHIQIRGPE
jgi:hypothetical protein